MNKEWKEKWIAALRSGEYRQGRRRLRTDEGFCCLGICEDLVLKQSGQEWQQNSFGEFRVPCDNQNEGDVVLTPETSKLFELPDGNPLIPRDLVDEILGEKRVEELVQHRHEISVPLAALNDAGATFEEIADIIEAAF